MKRFWMFLLRSSFVAVLLLGVYVLSICWRVSVAEQINFGRTDLIHLSLFQQKYSKKYGPAVKEAHGGGTFEFNRKGRRIVVWRQKVNGFQHIYGSALAAYELGEKPADLLFCANEYAEAWCDIAFTPHGVEPGDLRDRRKDLYHNRLGRQVGLDARKLKLSGRAAERYMVQHILAMVDTGTVYIPHYNDPRVEALPTETLQGCPGLPPVFSLYGRKPSAD